MRGPNIETFIAINQHGTSLSHIFYSNFYQTALSINMIANIVIFGVINDNAFSLV